MMANVLKYLPPVRADVLKMTIWQTPAGIVDEGGVVLPSWLNFGITLLGPPANGIMHVSATIYLISPPSKHVFPATGMHSMACWC